MTDETPQSKAPPRNAFKKKLKFVAFFALGIAILLVILQSLGITPAIALEALLNVGYFYSALIIAIYFILTFFVALKWRAIVMTITPDIAPYKGYFMYYGALSFLVNGLIPQAGFGVRVGSLKLLYGVPTSKGIMIQFIDQLTDLTVIVMLFFPGLLYVMHLLTIEEALLFLLATIATVFLAIKFTNVRRVKRVGNWLAGRTTGLKRFSLFEKFSALFVDVPFEKLNITWLMFIGLIRILFSIYCTLIMMWAAGISITYMELLLVAPVVYLIGLFSFTPQGIGTVDAGWLGV